MPRDIPQSSAIFVFLSLGELALTVVVLQACDSAGWQNRPHLTNAASHSD